MAENIAVELAKLRTALAGLEAQRALLGEAVVEPALAALRQQIAILEAAGAEHSTEREERRIVTILFSDIVGSTSLAEKMDPEDWRRVVGAVHGMAGKLVQVNQGEVLQYLGDGLLAIFGGQATSERDTENAVRAALEIQNAIGLQNLIEGESQAVSATSMVQSTATVQNNLEMRIGIHTGLVVIGEMGSEAKKEFTATGDAMNLAARLQSAAPPGGVLISHDTFRYVRGIFEMTPQPPLTVKGKKDPLQTYLVRRARPQPFRGVSRGVAGIDTRTIGRAAELGQIQAAYLDAVENRKVVWVQLIGGPGLGKSRLISDTLEFLALRLEDFLVLKARSVQGDEKQAFSLVRRFWLDRFSIFDDTPLELAESKWVKGLLDLGVSEEAAHALGLLVGLPFAGSSYLQGLRSDPAQVKGRAFVISRELFARMRAQMPVVLLLEDMHWTDAASWEYLAEVVLEEVHQITSSPPESTPSLNGLYVLGAARPEWEPPQLLAGGVLRDVANDSRTAVPPGTSVPAGISSPAESDLPARNFCLVLIQLTPLTEIAGIDLAMELLQRVEGVPEELIQMIVKRSEGVPYFIEEMVNWLLDRGVIDSSTEPWRFLPNKIDASPLPATLQHLLLTRLSSLTETERSVLQRGSIFGRHFWEGGIKAMGDLSPDRTSQERSVARAHSGINTNGFGQILEGLINRGFVHPQPQSSFEGEAEWSFHHNLQREVAYESVLKRKRKELHKIAAGWLEAQSRRAGRLDEFAGVLGDHIERAGEPGVAAGWFLLAGQYAMQRGAFLEARRLFDCALEYTSPNLSSQPEARELREQRWQLLLGRSEVLLVLGEITARQADDQALLDLAAESGNDDWLAEAHYRNGHRLSLTGDQRAALLSYQIGLAAARRAKDRKKEALLLGMLVHTQARLGEWQTAAESAQAALVLAREVGDEDTLARILTNTASYYSATGDLARACEFDEQQVEITHRIGNLIGEAIGQNNLGYAYIILGLYSLGRAACQRGLELALSIGYRHHAAFTRLNLALALWRQGDFKFARETLALAIPELSHLRDAFGQAAGWLYLALVDEQSQEIETAWKGYNQARQAFQALEVIGSANDALAGMARCALTLGRLADALQYTDELWSLLSQRGPQGMELPLLAYQTCVKIFNILGETQKARAALEYGYHNLIERAAKISDLSRREIFLENVPEHRFFRQAFEEFSE